MSNFSKIIIFTIHPVNNDYAKRYGVEFFRENNIDITFINLSILIYGIDKIKRCGYDLLNTSDGVDEISILNYRDLHSYLRSQSNGTIIYLNITAPAKLLTVICKLKFPYIDGSLWGGIQKANEDSFIEQFLQKVRKMVVSPLSHFNRKIDHVLSKLLRLLCPPCLILTMNPNDVSMQRTYNVVLNHTFDYDRFMINRDLEKPAYIPNHKYYVLLPNHAWMLHDYIINDAQFDCAMTKDRYSCLINKTLNKIESLTGVKILVAGYPNATIKEDVYIGRRFLLETETEQLVKYSSGVITHFTGAVNFAVLHNKPVCIINYIDFNDDPRFTSSIKSYAKSLNLPINYVNTDQQVEALVSNGLFSMNDKLYKMYRNKYICSDEIRLSEQKLFWERVIENIN